MYTGMSTALKPCGELMCAAYQFCMPHDMQCYPCNSYCDKNSANFDKNYCENQCKDYIEDKLNGNDDFMFSTFVSTTAFIWILFLVHIMFIMMLVKRSMRKINKVVMLHDAIIRKTSGQTVILVIKQKSECDQLP